MKKLGIGCIVVVAVLLAGCASTKVVDVVPEMSVVSADLSVLQDVYSETVVRFTANGRTTVGTLCLPTNATAPVPAVVMLHGTGSSRDEAGNGYAYAAPAMAASGIATLRIDMIGAGDSEVGYEFYNYETAVEDAVAAKEFLRGLSSIDGSRIGVMGWSQGGTNAISAAAADSGFKSVVLWAGALDLTILVTPQQYEEAKANGFSMLELGWRAPLKLGLQWFDDVFTKDMDAYVKQIKAPVLALNGENDDVVDPSSGAHIAEICANPASRQILIPGADHTFNVFSDPELKALSQVVGTTTAWFLYTL